MEDCVKREQRANATLGIGAQRKMVSSFVLRREEREKREEV